MSSARIAAGVLSDLAAEAIFHVWIRGTPAPTHSATTTPQTLRTSITVRGMIAAAGIPATVAIRNPVRRRPTPGRTIRRQGIIVADRHLHRAATTITADHRIRPAVVTGTLAEHLRRVEAIAIPVDHRRPPDQVIQADRRQAEAPVTRVDLRQEEVTRAAAIPADPPEAATQEDQVRPVRVLRVRTPADRVRLAHRTQAVVRVADTRRAADAVPIR